MSLQLLDVSKAFGEVKVLDGISLDFAPGSLTLVRGPSGSGKSTLLRVATLLEPVDAGQVLLDGQYFAFSDLFRADAWSKNWPFRLAVSVVFQQLHMWPHMRMNDAIDRTWRGGPGFTERADLVERLGLAGLEGRFPRQLSLGQLQRFALLRALGTGARYYFLDEVTSALDSASRDRVVALIRELVKFGCSVILVSHDTTLFGGEWHQLVSFGALGDSVNVESA